MNALPVMFNINNGFRPCLYKEERKWGYVVFVDTPIRRVRVSKSEAKFMRPLDYPVKKAAKRMLKIGKKFGISSKAEQMLKEAKSAKPA